MKNSQLILKLRMGAPGKSSGWFTNTPAWAQVE